MRPYTDFKNKFYLFFPITIGPSVWTVWPSLLLPSCCLLQSSGHPLEACGCMMKTPHFPTYLSLVSFNSLLLLQLGLSPTLSKHPSGSYKIFHSFLLNSEQSAIPILCPSPITRSNPKNQLPPGEGHNKKCLLGTLCSHTSHGPLHHHSHPPPHKHWSFRKVPWHQTDFWSINNSVLHGSNLRFYLFFFFFKLKK